MLYIDIFTKNTFFFKNVLSYQNKNDIYDQCYFAQF